jgi:drug/metabolite transporter (DMT)-like permease
MRKVLSVIVAGTIAVCAASSVQADESQSVYAVAYVNGNNYQEYDAATRTIYVMGVVVGLAGSFTMGGSSRRASALGACLKGLPGAQVRAVGDKYMADNPAHWDLSMSILVYNAINTMCNQRGTPIYP